MRPVELGILALLVLNLGLVAALLVRRSFSKRTDRRRDALIARLRPSAVEFVEGDEGEAPPQLRGEEADVYAELLAAFARVLRGESRLRIASYFETTGAVEDRIGRLGSRRAWRRASAAFALGDMGSRNSVPELLRVLDDPVRDVRMAAARSLGRLRTVEAIEPLVAAGVRGSVPREVSSLALFDIGSTAVPQLLELVAHTEPEIRSDALELIGLLGTAGDSKPVADHLQDPAAPARAAAADALGRLGAAEARDALVRALGDRVPAVRAAAARALGQIGGRQATEALLPVARSDSFEPAREAAEALARIDPTLVIRVASEPGAGPHLREAADLAAL